MRTLDLVKKLEGIHTIESIMDILNIDRTKAIYYIHRLRKKGYVKTKRTNKKRIYQISFENRLGGWSYYDIINENSPIKIVAPIKYLIHGKEKSIEETIIFAIKTRSLRTILAALPLFKKVKDWSRLYVLAKQEHIQREIGALYDLTKRIIRIRKMTKRFRNNTLPKKNQKPTHIISGLRSDDFKDIEKIWKVYIPFNKADLGEYR